MPGSVRETGACLTPATSCGTTYAGGRAGNLQFRQLVEGTDDTDLMGTEVDGNGSLLRHDDSTETVLVVRDAILNGEPLDRLHGLEVEGTAGKGSALGGGGSWLHHLQYAPTRRREPPGRTGSARRPHQVDDRRSRPDCLPRPQGRLTRTRSRASKASSPRGGTSATSAAGPASTSAGTRTRQLMWPSRLSAADPASSAPRTQRSSPCWRSSRTFRIGVVRSRCSEDSHPNALTVTAPVSSQP